MSVINGLYSQVLRSSVGFTATGTAVYATIPWYPQSTIDELKITNIIYPLSKFLEISIKN